MPSAGFEPAFPASERSQTHNLDPSIPKKNIQRELFTNWMHLWDFWGVVFHSGVLQGIQSVFDVNLWPWARVSRHFEEPQNISLATRHERAEYVSLFIPWSKTEHWYGGYRFTEVQNDVRPKTAELREISHVASTGTSVTGNYEWNNWIKCKTNHHIHIISTTAPILGH